MSNIYFFRPGTTANKENVFLGWTNALLSKKGFLEAERVAKKLSGKNIDYAFCSDQLRGKQALIEVMKYHPNAKIIIDSRLREKHHGVYTGVSKNLLKKHFPKKYAELRSNYYVHVLGGENMLELSKRVFFFMNDLMIFADEEDADILVCAHTNPMRLIRQYFDNLGQSEVMLVQHPPHKHLHYKVKFGKK